MVKILPAATETVENPAPIPCPFHASGGPFLGHSLSSPVSVEILSRLGPRHCGQGPAESPVGVGARPRVTNSMSASDNMMVARRVIGFPPLLRITTDQVR